MAKLIGGPRDGLDVGDKYALASRLRIPVLQMPGALWLEEHDPMPTWTDEWGEVHFGHKTEFLDHEYIRGEDGNFHYQGEIRRGS